MNVVNKYVFILLGFMGSVSWAQAQETCLSIQADYVSLIESGKYRFVNEKNHELSTALGSELSSEVIAEPLKAVDFDKLSNYQQYLIAAYQVIENRNPKANMPCPIITDTYRQLAQQNHWSATPKISQLVAPYELTQSSQNNETKAILLIHGLTDSPFSFHDLSQFFYQQGFTVRTLLMPGHGTAPSDLLTVEYSAWQQAARFAIEQTLKDFDEVYLGGLSTGGALIFDYLMQQKQIDKKIKGLFMWSPASKAKSDFAWLAKYVDMIPFVDWINLDADIDFAKYESFPFNAAAQVDSIMRLVVGSEVLSSRQLHGIPIFVVASEYDQTIDTEHTLQLVQEWQLASPTEQMKKSVLIYYGNEHKLPQQLAKVMKLIVPECSPQSLCNDIFDVSHIATTHSPDNPHYGVNGKYRNCGHYVSDASRYYECKQSKQVIKGEVTAANLARDYPMQRLTYNPYYQEMLVEMTLFLQATH
ncbi:MAG: alpha/beta fold hydrolase [Colwellia sp.]